MTAAKTKTAVSAARRAMLAKVHKAQKDMALAEESYRDLLERVTGRRSAAHCSDAQLDAVLAEFRRLGWRAKAPKRGRKAARTPAEHPEARKMRALWLSLYHLGEVRDPSEAALVAFAKRVTGGRLHGIDAIQWIKGAAAQAVIEALKDWGARAGVDWSPYATASGEPLHAPRARVLEAQWRRLHALGAVRIADPGALASWLYHKGYTPGLRAPINLDNATADKAIEALGRWVRKARAEA